MIWSEVLQDGLVSSSLKREVILEERGGGRRHVFFEEAGAFINRLHMVDLLMDVGDDIGRDWSLCPSEGESLVAKK